MNDVRLTLIPTMDENSGILMLQVRDVKGYICDKLWSNEDAMVACRQLNLPFTGTAVNTFLASNKCCGYAHFIHYISLLVSLTDLTHIPKRKSMAFKNTLTITLYNYSFSSLYQ